jgi:dipeptidase E
VALNALDNLENFPRDAWLQEECRVLAQLGLHGFELGLRAYFDRQGALQAALGQTALVWVTGGNVFVLRDAMRRSELDALLLEQVGSDAIAYAGYSAGACVAGVTLHGLERVDDVTAVRQPLWDGLALVDIAIAPHYRSDHPESERIDAVIRSFPAALRIKPCARDKRWSSTATNRSSSSAQDEHLRPPPACPQSAGGLLQCRPSGHLEPASALGLAAENAEAGVRREVVLDGLDEFTVERPPWRVARG